MASRYFIQLQVTGDVNDSWHLTWQDPAWPERHYHVDPQLLDAAAKDVRTALQQVVDDARAQTVLGPSLKALATAGAEFRKAIFLTHGAGIDDAKFMRDEHLSSRDDWQLLISINQRVYLPWGLAYDGDGLGYAQRLRTDR